MFIAIQPISSYKEKNFKVQRDLTTILTKIIKHAFEKVELDQRIIFPSFIKEINK